MSDFMMFPQAHEFHFSLRVADLAASTNFYGSLLSTFGLRTGSR